MVFWLEIPEEFLFSNSDPLLFRYHDRGLLTAVKRKHLTTKRSNTYILTFITNPWLHECKLKDSVN